MHLSPVLARVSDSLRHKSACGDAVRHVVTQRERAGMQGGGADSTVVIKWSWFFLIGYSASDGTECLNSCCDGTNGPLS